MKGNDRIPKVYYHGFQRENRLYCIVLQLLGESLKNIVRHYRNIPIPTVSKIAVQLINIVQIFHDKGYVHADIKVGLTNIFLKK